MSALFSFSGTPGQDWPALCDIWRESQYVLSGEVGPAWETPIQHQVCLDFAQRYPDAKPFLLEQLLDQDPRIAAYAFKILIRLDVQEDEIPAAALKRQDPIGMHHHSRIQPTSLGRFIADFFGKFNRVNLKESDQRTEAWQKGPLAEYKRANAQNAQGQTEHGPGKTN